MKKVSIITPEEAALKVQDGDTIATGGFVSCACPETLSKALEKRFLETGHPQNLTLFFAAGQGHRDGTGGDHYGHEGMVKRVIGGHWDRAPKLGELALNNKIEAYNLPQGVISHMYRDIAAHNIGTITHVGLKTFADPRNGGGKLNDCLLYTSPVILDFAQNTARLSFKNAENPHENQGLIFCAKVL